MCMGHTATYTICVRAEVHSDIIGVYRDPRFPDYMRHVSPIPYALRVPSRFSGACLNMVGK